MNGLPTIEQRVLLALQDETDFLPTGDLIACIYVDDVPPPTAAQLVRKAVLRLRERGHVILSRPGRKSPGYRLVMP